MPRVETAQLSLMAVMSRFPDDLRKLVLKMPPPEAMVVLPLPTIQKMLPTGSVKMSLASVVRQAPPGTFATINPQDKRLVEVPLAEIFKRISPALLKKRPDQKQSELAVEGFDIFGDEENPHSLAPKVEGVQQAAAAPAAPTLGVPPAKVLKVPPGVVTAPPSSVPLPATASANAAAPLPKPKPLGKPAAAPAPAAPAPAPVAPAVPAPVPVAQPAAAPKIAAKAPAPVAPAVSEKTKFPKKATAPAAPAAAAVGGDQPPLVISLGEILGSWPEPIKSEAAALNGSTVSLPAGDVAAGLQRGKIVFSWGQLRSWMNPAPGSPSQAADSTELILPLRVIAPAFMKHTKGAGTARKAGEVGDIPELFAGRNKPAAKAPAPEPEAPAPEPEKAPEPEAKAPEPAVEEKAPEPTPEAKAPEPEPEAKAPEPAPAPAPEVEAPAPEAEAPAANVEAPAPEPEAPNAEAPAAEPEAPAAKEEPVAAKAEPQPEPEAKPEPAPAPAPTAEPAAAAASAALPQTLGELFGEPDKTSWSPTEIVNRFSELPDVAGAVVALQEGLVIAHKLPEPLKGEIFAAFLPQLFARMNQYAGEMKLGGVNEVTLQTEAGPCYLFRRDQVFFAALGKPDSALPAHNLRLCADAVAS